MELRPECRIQAIPGLVARPQGIAEGLYDMVGGDPHVGGPVLDHPEYRVEHPRHGTQRARLGAAEALEAVEVPEQLVSAVDEVNDHDAGLPLTGCAGLPTWPQISRRSASELAATNERRSMMPDCSPLRSLTEPPASVTHTTSGPMSQGFISGSIAPSRAPRHTSAYCTQSPTRRRRLAARARSRMRHTPGRRARSLSFRLVRPTCATSSARGGPTRTRRARAPSRVSQQPRPRAA